MKRLVIALGLLLLPALAHAQVVPTDHLGWDQKAAFLAEAQAFTYTLYADGATTGTVLTGVVCSGAVSPYLCQVPFPAFTPGSHSITITAKNAAGESPKATAFTFTFVVVPESPLNLRRIGGELPPLQVPHQ